MARVGKVPPSCHRVGKSSVKVVKPKAIYIWFLTRKSLFLLEPNSSCTFYKKLRFAGRQCVLNFLGTELFNSCVQGEVNSSLAIWAWYKGAKLWQKGVTILISASTPSHVWSNNIFMYFIKGTLFSFKLEVNRIESLLNYTAKYALSWLVNLYSIFNSATL